MKARAGTKRQRPASGGVEPVQEEPTPPFPEQHQDKPGIGCELDPAPRYRAKSHRSAGKLLGR
jgi:hypothetical protein